MAAAMILVSPVALSAGTNPVGMNPAAVYNYAVEFPFLNIVKMCGGGSTQTIGWWTTKNNGPPTGEELLLNFDSDGYPTNLPQAGLTSNMVTCQVFNSPTGVLAPGQTYFYPPGSYTVQFSGAGTVTIGGDASASISSSGGTFTVANPTGAGLYISITSSISGNHLHNLSIVQTSLLSSYNSGAIFHPTFLAAEQNFKSFRFMDWRNTNGQAPIVSNSSGTNIPSGTTSVTLNSPWNYPSGTYTIYFGGLSNSAPQSEQKSATFTNNSTTVTWTGGTLNNYLPYFAVDVSASWANRVLPSKVFYTLTDGVPVEIQVALCNAVGANCWMTVPVTASDSYIESWAKLVISGTGAQSGYSGLNSGLLFYAELSNEVWNGGFAQSLIATTLGYQMWPSQVSGGGYGYNRNWYGMRVAQMASDLQTALGAAFSRCVPVLGAQAASSYSATQSLSAPYWTTGTGAPSSYPIKAIAIAPYWGGNPNATDATTMTGVAKPLDDFFSTLTSQTGTSANGSHTYSSVPTGGWLGQAEGWISSYVAIMSSYPNVSLVGYEGGQNFYVTSSGTASGWPALVISAERDTRMGAAYTNFLTYWSSTVGGGSANIINLLTDASTMGSYGAWGALENIMQSISQLSSAPAKWQGIQNFICSGSSCSPNIPMAPTNLVVK
jgi:hypothetical protein